LGGSIFFTNRQVEEQIRKSVFDVPSTKE